MQQDLRVNHAQLKTSNAPIEVGFIEATGSLVLATSNGSINANTTLTNVGRSGTRLDMVTSNGCVLASYSTLAPLTAGPMQPDNLHRRAVLTERRERDIPDPRHDLK